LYKFFADQFHILLIGSLIFCASTINILDSLKILGISFKNIFFAFILFLIILYLLTKKVQLHLHHIMFFVLFIIIGLISVFYHQNFSYSTLQNLFVYTGFLVILVYGLSIKREIFFTTLFQRLFVSSFVFLIWIALINTLTSGFGWGNPLDSIDGIILVEPRAYAIVVSMYLVVFLALWQQAYSTKYFIYVILSLALIFLSVSRAAYVVSFSLILGLLFYTQIHLKRNLKKEWSLFGIAIFLFTFFMFSFNDVYRFINEGTTTIDTTGRMEIWLAVIDSYIQSVYIGHGFGSAEWVQTDLWFGAGKFNYQPHNDYLRILHDTGFIGLLLILTQFLIWMKLIVLNRVLDKTIVSIAFFSIFVVFGNALVNNPIVYPFVMFPLGLIIGVALQKTEYKC
jgi:O-antigen ligase